MSQPRVLLVDDDELVAQAIEEVLSLLGFTVVWARTAEEGWLRFCGCQPDVVMTDNSMPDMSGLELARRIREVSPQATVVMLSAIPPPEADCVCDLVLSKPVRLAALREGLCRIGVLSGNA